jgi:hypothetical protein
VVHPKRLGTLPVADPPAEDALRPSRHLHLGDIALHDPGGVRLSPILEGWVGPILDGLDEAAADAYGHYATDQPLRLQLLLVV